MAHRVVFENFSFSYDIIINIIYLSEGFIHNAILLIHSLKFIFFEAHHQKLLFLALLLVLIWNTKLLDLVLVFLLWDLIMFALTLALNTCINFFLWDFTFLYHLKKTIFYHLYQHITQNFNWYQNNILKRSTNIIFLINFWNQFAYIFCII